MSNEYDEQQEKVGMFLFLLGMVIFGGLSIYLWFT